MTPRLGFRLGVLTAAAVFMLVGPVARQMLGVNDLWYRPWVMYRGWGAKVCDVAFVAEAPNGERIAVDRLDLLGFQSWYDAPRRVRTLQDDQAVRTQGQALCKRLPEGTTVRVTSRCGRSGHGWQLRLDDEAVCEGTKR